LTVRRALAISFVDRYVGFSVNLGSSMVIARLLTPAEVGIYSIVMVLSGFVAVFRDLGAGQYMLRHPNLTPDVMRRTFTVQFSMGLVLSALVGFAGSPIAAFYGEPRMQLVCWVLAANFAVTPFLAYPVAWLTREMRFGHLAWTRAVGAVGGAAVSIGLVLNDLGPLSLAWGNLATTVAGLLLLLLAARPKLPWRLKWRGLGEVLAFGGGLTLVSLIGSLRASLPEIVVGRVLGLTQAGYLSRGQSLCSTFETLVMGAVGSVTLPFLARTHRQGLPLGPVLSRTLALLCGVGWPFFAMLAILAEPLILLLFGTQWREAVAPVRGLALAAAAFLPLSVVSSALVVTGRIRTLLGMQIAAAVAVGLGLTAGISGGLVAATVGMGVTAVGNMLVCLVVLRRPLNMTVLQVLAPLGQAIFLSVSTCVIPMMLSFFLVATGYASAALLCFLSGIGALVGLSLSAWAVRHPLWNEIILQRARLKRS
jgi:O-antigen/teichoic acid export membrane protein